MWNAIKVGTPLLTEGEALTRTHSRGSYGPTRQELKILLGRVEVRLGRHIALGDSIVRIAQVVSLAIPCPYR